jgi:hypothetical protein
MEPTYYVPEISDLKPGDEIEIYAHINRKMVNSLRWHTVKIHVSTNEPGEFVSFNRLPQLLKRGEAHIPYLTKSQIVSQGWVYEVLPELSLWWGSYRFDKENYILTITPRENNNLRIIEKEGRGFLRGLKFRVLYDGSCPSLNHLKSLMNLLNIE